MGRIARLATAIVSTVLAAAVVGALGGGTAHAIADSCYGVTTTQMDLGGVLVCHSVKEGQTTETVDVKTPATVCAGTCIPEGTPIHSVTVTLPFTYTEDDLTYCGAYGEVGRTITKTYEYPVPDVLFKTCAEL